MSGLQTQRPEQRALVSLAVLPKLQLPKHPLKIFVPGLPESSAYYEAQNCNEAKSPQAHAQMNWKAPAMHSLMSSRQALAQLI